MAHSHLAQKPPQVDPETMRCGLHHVVGQSLDGVLDLVSVSQHRVGPLLMKPPDAKLGIHQKQVSGYERGVHVPQTELLIRIAETFGVSLDYLAFADRDDTNLSGIADRELLEKLQALDQLPDTDRAIVKSVLDTYITKHRIQQLTGTGEPAA